MNFQTGVFEHIHLPFVTTFAKVRGPLIILKEFVLALKFILHI